MKNAKTIYLTEKVMSEGKIKYNCTECGAEIIAHIGYYSNGKKILNADLWDLKCCPICNNELVKKFPFTQANLRWASMTKKQHDSYDKYRKEFDSHGTDFDRFGHPIPPSDEVVAIALKSFFEAPEIEKADSFIKSCDVNIVNKFNHKTVVLKDYISHLINLESNILSMSQRLKELYLLRGENNRDIIFDSNYPIYQQTLSIKQEIDNLNLNLDKIICEYQKEKNKDIIFEKTTPPSKPSPPVLTKAHFFNKKKIEAQNALLIAEYEKKMRQYEANILAVVKKNKFEMEKALKEKERLLEKYNRTIDDYKKKISHANNEIKKLHDKKKECSLKSIGTKQLINTEIELLEDSLKESFKCRNEMYSFNIIFDKYRNIVALSTFYEYLMAGRCESLDGINGAYNIYENEIRLDKIITGLDEIETKLDEIKKNQYMVYRTMKSIETSLNSLDKSMGKAVKSLDSIDTKATNMNEYLEKISNNTEVIAYNTEITAYYSKKNAELTNALGFMVALK